jgi:hypothetical protein
MNSNADTSSQEQTKVAATPVEIRSHGAGPLSMLLDTYPRVDSVDVEALKKSNASSQPRVQTYPYVTTIGAAYDKFAKEIGSPQAHAIYASEPLVLNDEITRQAYGSVKAAVLMAARADPAFAAELNTNTRGSNIIDNDPRSAKFPFLQNNIYGRVLVDVRESSEVYQQEKRISAVAIRMLERVCAVADPRTIVKATKSAERPMVSLIKQCASKLQITGVKIVPRADEDLGYIDGLYNQLTNVENYPMVDHADLLRFVLVNRGMAKQLYDTVPGEVARRIVTKTLKRSLVRKTAADRDATVYEKSRIVAAKLRDGSYKKSPKMVSMVIDATRNLWFDATFWRAFMRRQPVSMGVLEIPKDSRLSPYHVSVESPFQLYKGASSFSVPSVAHIISMTVFMEAFTKHAASDYNNSPDRAHTIYRDVVLNHKQAHEVSPERACQNVYMSVFTRGFEMITPIVSNVRQNVFVENKWLRSAVRVAHRANVLVPQNSRNSAENFTQLTDWLEQTPISKNLALDEGRLKLTLDGIQHHSLCQWIIVQRVAEIIRATSRIFSLPMEGVDNLSFGNSGHVETESNIVKCHAAYCAVFDGAFYAPNVSNRHHPRVYDSILDLLAKQRIGNVVMGGGNREIIRYVASLALDELYTNLGGREKGSEALNLDEVLTTFCRKEAEDELAASMACTHLDIHRALSNVAKRLASLAIACNRTEIPDAQQLLKAAASVLSAGSFNSIVDTYRNTHVLEAVYTEPSSQLPIFRASPEPTEAAVMMEQLFKRASDIDATAPALVTRLLQSSVLLRMRKVMLWSRLPPVSVSLFNAFQRKQYRFTTNIHGPYGNFTVGWPDSWPHNMVNEDAVVHDLAHALDSYTGARSTIINEASLKTALVGAATRLFMVIEERGVKFNHTSQLVSKVLPMILVSDERARQVGEALENFPPGRSPVTDETLFGVCDRAVADIVAAGLMDNIDGNFYEQRVHNLTLPPRVGAMVVTGTIPRIPDSDKELLAVPIPKISPQTDLIPYRPIEYIAPASQSGHCFHRDTQGPITTADLNPTKYILFAAEAERSNTVPFDEIDLDYSAFPSSPGYLHPEEEPEDEMALTTRDATEGFADYDDEANVNMVEAAPSAFMGLSSVISDDEGDFEME